MATSPIGKVILLLVCPVTTTAPGIGFEVKLPRDWVKRYGPAFRCGMTFLKGLKDMGVEIPIVSKAFEQVLHKARCGTDGIRFQCVLPQFLSSPILEMAHSLVWGLDLYARCTRRLRLSLPTRSLGSTRS